MITFFFTFSLAAGGRLTQEHWTEKDVEIIGSLSIVKVHIKAKVGFPV